MSYARGPKIITDALDFYLDAGNTKSYPGTGTIWKDLSGNGNDAALFNNPTHTKGGFQFRSDVQNYVRGTSTTILKGDDAGSWSLEVVFKFISSSQGESFLTGKVGCHSGALLSGSHVLTQIATDDCFVGGIRKTITNVDLIAGNYYQVVVTYNNGVVKTYINTVLESTDTIDINTYNTKVHDDYIYIGGMGHPTAFNTNTDICISRGYTKELSQGEISQNYNATKSRFGL